MKKKLFAILLSLVMILSSVSILSEVSFAEGENYVLTDSAGDQLLATDKANTLITYMNTPSKFDQTKSYTLTLNGDLVIPVEGSKLKTLEIHCNLTIEGNNKTITGAAGGEQGDRFIEIKGGNINIKKLNFDGSDMYAGILSDNTAADHNPSLNISDCNFTNLNTKTTDNFYCNTGGPAISVVNTDIEAKRVKISNSKSSYYGGGVYIEVSSDVMSNGKYSLEDCGFNNCKSQFGGGALALFGSNGSAGNYLSKQMKSSIFIKDCSIESCKTQGSGGAILMMERVKAEITDDSSIIDCEANVGGAIYMYSSTKLKILNNTHIKNCKAKDGGAINGNVNHESSSDDNFEDLIIKDSFIYDCKAQNGGALYLSYTDLVFENTLIKNCNSDNFGNIYLVSSKASIIKSTFDSNTSGSTGGAIQMTGESDEKISIEGCKFINNKATYSGGAIHCDGAEFDIKSLKIDGNEIKTEIKSNEASMGAGIYFDCSRVYTDTRVNIEDAIISKNKASVKYDHDLETMGMGAGLYLSLGSGNRKVSIKGGEISNNSAAQFGGGIYVFDKYDDTELEDKNQKLIINDNVKFSGNTAGYGYYNPPENYKDYENFTHDTHSRPKRIVAKEGKEYEHVDSLLNNYDINYVNKETSTVYDPNGGQGKLFYVNEGATPYDNGFIKDHTVKIKELKETNISNGNKKLSGWSTEPNGKGPIYQPGDEHTLKGNLYLYAIWENVQDTVRLTLDENYRGGKITDKEVMAGDLIEPHLYKPKRRGFTFKGWSYDKKHLDEVKADDRIYTDTTLYAIWKKAEIEKHEEPEEIRGEEHKAYIFGYPNGTVRPNGNITRAEAAAMLARLLNIEAIGSSAKPNFIDTESSWYNKAINAIVARGIMKGYPDGRFKPNAPITRAEFTQMISTIDNKPYGEAPFVDVKGHWAERAIGSEYQAKRITGYPDGLFRPDANITRAEAAVILNKIFERNYDAMSLAKCKNALMLKRFIDLDETFWGYNDMVEATNTHEYIRRYKGMVPEDWLLIK